MERKNNAIKVMLVQIANRNLGDSVIADTARFLIRQCLTGREHQIFDYSITSGDLMALSYADVIVFSGGSIIKFRQENFDLLIIPILNEAQRLSIPVYFNAVGVEGYDPNDERCQNLKAALNLPCVKGISIRDDYTTILDNYITNPDIAVTSVFDPATWSDKVYSRVNYPISKRIGLGVARESLFVDYGSPEINREFLLEFWKNTASELERRGYDWEIFTNGLQGDEQFAQEVLAYIGHGRSVPRPAEPEQLINTICSYEAVIACRMHANILAHTFAVPSVGLVWNEKLAFWGEKTGHSDRFLRPAQMQPALVVEKVIQAAAEGCNRIEEDQLLLAKNALYDFLKDYAVVRNQNCRPDRYSEKIAADALGGKYLKYKNLNTIEGMERSIKGGCLWLETDVRLSSDGKLVCVNGWNANTYTMLGLNAENYTTKGVDLGTFLKLRYQNTYQTATFEQILRVLEKHHSRGIKLFVDIGRPSQQDLDKMVTQLERTVIKHIRLLKHIYLRLQRKQDVARVKKSILPWKIAFYLPKEDEGFKDGIWNQEESATFCVENNISIITMAFSRFDKATGAFFHSKEIRCCIMKITKISDILTALDDGADIVSSVYTDALTLNELTS